MTLIDTPPQKKKRDDEELALLLFWHEHAPTAYAGLIDGNGWTFDPVRQEYISDNGTRLGDDDLKFLALMFIVSVEDSIRADAVDVANEDITPSEWRERMQANVDETIWALGALAAGGVDNLTDEDRATIQGEISTDEKLGSGIADATDRLNDFADELEHKEAGSQAQIRARAASYPKSAYAVYQRVRTNSHARVTDDSGKKLFLYYRNVLAIADHCADTEFTDGCPTVTEAGWQPIGTLPQIGLRTCGNSCKCSWVFGLLPDEIDFEPPAEDTQ